MLLNPQQTLSRWLSSGLVASLLCLYLACDAIEDATPQQHTNSVLEQDAGPRGTDPTAVVTDATAPAASAGADSSGAGPAEPSETPSSVQPTTPDAGGVSTVATMETAPAPECDAGDFPGETDCSNEALAVCDTSCLSPALYLKGSSTEAADLQGFRVAVSGKTAVVGAPNEYPFAGAVYVYTLSGMDWREEARLRPEYPDPNTVMGFGWSVAVSGNTIVVGTPFDRYPGTGVNPEIPDDAQAVNGSGAAFVFQREAGHWRQRAFLKASNAEAGDEFGGGVAVAGDLIAVSARAEDSAATGIDGDSLDNSAPDSGAVYLFRQVGSDWIQEAYIKGSRNGTDGLFGFDLDLSGDSLAIGAPGDSWAPPGALDQDSSAYRLSGAAYVFVQRGDRWVEQAYLKPAHSNAYDVAGQDVAIFGDTLVVGAFGESSASQGSAGDPTDNSAENAGAALVYAREGEHWTEQAYLKAANAETADEFAAHVDIYGDWIVIGAHYEDGSGTGIDAPSDDAAPDSGAAYVFQRTAEGWQQLAYLKSNASEPDDRFGCDVSITEGAILVGAFGEDSAANRVDGDAANNDAPRSGAAYLFPWHSLTRQER